MDEPLKQSGAMRITTIGESVVRLIDTKGLYKLVCEYLSRDSSALLKKGEQRLTVATSPKELI